MIKPATIGHNQPDTQFEICCAEIEKWYEEAKLWLDGEKVEDEKTAYVVTEIKKKIAAARITAEKARKEDKEPHLEAGRRVDASYKPMLERAVLAEKGCATALLPWEQAQEAKRQEEARILREEAKRKRQYELATNANKDAANLEEIEFAEVLRGDAKKADKLAKRAEKAAEKTSIKTVYKAELKDGMAAVTHYWKLDKQPFLDLVQKMADGEVYRGARTIPGFEIIPEQKVR
jgi:hypothetical protein